MTEETTTQDAVDDGYIPTPERLKPALAAKITDYERFAIERLGSLKEARRHLNARCDELCDEYQDAKEDLHEVRAQIKEFYPDEPADPNDYDHELMDFELVRYEHEAEIERRDAEGVEVEVYAGTYIRGKTSDGVLESYFDGDKVVHTWTEPEKLEEA